MRPTPINIPSSELVRNFIFLGTTGAGKSTTCNTLYGNPNGPFPVGHDEISCTNDIINHVRESKRVRLIDTPGFGDNRFNDKQIEVILGGLTSVFLDRRVDSTRQVDAFLLVVKMNPRAQTLKEDLLRIRNLFGTQALRSLILLVIQRDDESKTDNREFLEKLKNMKEVVEILRQGKQEKPNENWYCMWDNVDPLQSQEEMLMEKIQKLEPYTSRRFLEAELEDKQVIDTQLQDEIDREVERYRNEVGIDGKVEMKEIEKIREELEKERRTFVEARNQAMMNMSKVVSAIEEMNGRTVGELEKLYNYMVKEQDERASKFMELMKSQEGGYTHQLDDFLKQNREILKRFESRIEEKVEESQESEKNKSIGQNIKKMFGLQEGASRHEKKEALKKTAKKGAETVAKKGVEAAVMKTAQEVAAKGVKKVGVKLCNLF